MNNNTNPEFDIFEALKAALGIIVELDDRNMITDNPAVLISIRPRWVEQIAYGGKTLEVRKNRPKLEPPFVCYIYQTAENGNGGDGHIIGEFVCDALYDVLYGECFDKDEMCAIFHKMSRLTLREAMNYSNYGKKKLYSWHISDLRLYDTPLDLSEFTRLDGEQVKRAPQSWMYVEKR